jgi:hypothetical protein
MFYLLERSYELQDVTKEQSCSFVSRENLKKLCSILERDLSEFNTRIVTSYIILETSDTQEKHIYKLMQADRYHLIIPFLENNGKIIQEVIRGK